jgi:hypothetical protein
LFAASLNPERELTEHEWEVYWDCFEAIHGLEGLPYAEWEHWKNPPRPPHRHRLYPRINVHGDGRIFATENDWIKNEAANALAAHRLNNHGFEPLLGKHSPAVYTVLHDRPEWRDAATWYAEHVRRAMREANQERATRGLQVFDIPADTIEAMRLYRKRFARAAANRAAQQQEKRADAGGDRLGACPRNGSP